MLKGSFSLKMLRGFDELVEPLERLDQNELFSGGDGWSNVRFALPACGDLVVQACKHHCH